MYSEISLLDRQAITTTILSNCLPSHKESNILDPDRKRVQESSIEQGTY